MKVTIEQVAHLTADEQLAVACASRDSVLHEDGLTDDERLDRFAANLRVLFRGWYVHVGGHHVALHRDHGDPRRALLVQAEDRPKAHARISVPVRGYGRVNRDRTAPLPAAVNACGAPAGLKDLLPSDFRRAHAAGGFNTCGACLEALDKRSLVRGGDR